MEIYNYRSKNPELSFNDGVNILREASPSLVFEGYPEITYSKDENEALLQELKVKGVEIVNSKIDKQQYLDYIDKAQYKAKYPNYYVNNFAEKSFEHFVALKLLQLGNNDVFIDIAAENSPHAEIFSNLTNCNGYMQDLMFPAGIHGKRIGGDAAKLPLSDCFANGILAACSIDHFEIDADISFVKEISRVLKVGGRIIVLPLYLHQFPFCVTDPRHSIPGKVKFDDGVRVHCVESYGNRHGRFYSPETLYKRIIEPNIDIIKFKIIYLENFREIDESIYCRFALLGERVLSTD